jgi:hypothetical protein
MSVPTIYDLCTPHPACGRILRYGKANDGNPGTVLNLHRHQEEVIRIVKRRQSYVLTSGTGSGKSLSYVLCRQRGQPCDWSR